MHSSMFKHLRPVKIGIRAEDASRIWERRAPLTPDAVHRLSRSAKVEVVSSPKRIYTDKEYIEAGATIVRSLTDSDIVLGIKEPPLHEVDALKAAPNADRQTHLMFSHTIKGQPYNTPLLSRYVHSTYAPESARPRLVDYELITNEEDGKRTVGFGWFAGVAGVLESLSSMAHSHLKLGYVSPFLYTPRPHTLPSLDNLRGALNDIGSLIAAHGTPPDLGPFIFGLTGNGQVSQGCLAMLSELPIQHVSADSLDSLMLLWKSSELDLRKIYLVHAKPEDYLVRLDGGKYDRTHYCQSPQSYMSIFAEKIAPYLTLFLNGTGWSPAFPRLMTNKQLEVALARAEQIGGARFRNIGDISCDVNGGLEFLSKATTLSSPTYEERPANLPSSLPSLQIMSVDILPASIPLDASNHFSNALEKHIDELVEFYYSTNPSARKTKGIGGGGVLASASAPFPKALDRATVAVGGKLREEREWLLPSVDRFFEKEREAKAMAKKEKAAGAESSASAHSSPSVQTSSAAEGTTDATTTASASATATSSSTDDWGLSTSTGGGRKRILILGSGMVAGPAVDLIAQNPNIDLVIASDSGAELQRLTGPHTSVKYRIINATKESTYAPLINKADVVISLLPATMHAQIAEVCIRGNTHLITASYMSDTLFGLDLAAREKGILILTEMGLDPGIDHCSAMDMLHKIGKDQQDVVSFTSFCGGIPVPEDSHVPLRYKFSWRPQGVLTAALNSAIFLLNKQIHTVPGSALLQHSFPNLPISQEFELEGLPNRDSMSYKSLYRIPSTIDQLRTFMRGTLRYPGFSSLMQSFAALGLLENTRTIRLKSWHTLVDQSLDILRARGTDTTLSSLIKPENVEPLRDALEWLGLAQPSILHPESQDFPPRTMPPVPQGPLTPLDLFAFLLSQKLKYAKDERDMVVLSHEIITKKQDAPVYWEELVYTSTLIVKGTTSYGLGFVGARPSSAMARTVGLPVAIAAMLVAEGHIKDAGVLRPTDAHIFRPILDGLEKVGIFMKEKSGRKKAVRSVLGQTVEDSLIANNRTLHPANFFDLKEPAFIWDLDDDKTWKEDEGVVVKPSSQY